MQEWVTPKISLMEAMDTDGSGKFSRGAEKNARVTTNTGPS